MCLQKRFVKGALLYTYENIEQFSCGRRMDFGFLTSCLKVEAQFYVAETLTVVLIGSTMGG